MDEVRAERYVGKLIEELSISQRKVANRLISLELLRLDECWCMERNFQIVHIFRCEDDPVEVSGWSKVDENGHTGNAIDLRWYRYDALCGLHRGPHPQKSKSLFDIIGDFSPAGG